MPQISSEQKLKLVHTIREEHKSNQMSMRNRENILFGTNLPLVETNSINEIQPVGNGVSSLGKIRMCIAAALFAGFVFLDITKTTVGGIDSAYVKGKIVEDFQANVFDFIETIPYTLEE